YSTFLGPANGDGAIAVDAAGNAYATGSTSFASFPATPGAFQASPRGASDVFVTKLHPTGSQLVYSTFLGGTAPEFAWGIAVDTSGNAYVTEATDSSDFPTTPGVFQPNLAGSDDAFVTKLNPTGAGLVYSTYLGGSNVEQSFGIAVDASGNAYVTGFTQS